MKKLNTALLAFSLVALAACAGAKKKEGAAAAPAPSSSPSSAPADAAVKAKPAEAKKGVAPAAGTGTVCALNQDERTITVVPTGPGCELLYRKFGESQAVASSVSGTGHCERIRDRIRANLESAGFACK